MREIFRSPKIRMMFWAGVILRFALLPFFGSHYLREMFIPFLDQGAMHPFANPWAAGVGLFPYGVVLYVLMAIPKAIGFALFGQAALGATPLSLSLAKLPLLAADLGLLGVLLRFSPRKSKAVLLYYWLNPALLFITYISGQLDVVAMSFCLLSLWLLIEKRTLPSALAMAAAALCKFHVALLVPIVLVYLWNNSFKAAATRQIITWLTAWLGLTALGFIPLLAANRLLGATAGSPEALRLFGAKLELAGGHPIYLGIALVLAVLGRLCISTRITGEGLVYGAGVVFGSVVLASGSVPNWYFWVLPFVCSLYANYANAPVLLYWAHQVFYLAYAVAMQFFPETVPPLVFGGLFTVLQTSLGALLVTMWVLVVHRQATLARRARPILIGIAGDSGSGKNHLSGVFQQLFRAADTVVVEGDDYHKWERGNPKWRDYTHLNPRANHLAEMAFHTRDLLEGRLVFQPHYDHGNGSFTAPREIRPSKAVVIQGLHSFYLRGMRKEFDLKVFLQPDERVRLLWKLQRDVRERGQSAEYVVKSLKLREKDSRSHIFPQRDLADLIIEVVPSDDFHLGEAELLEHLQAPDLKLGARYTTWNDAPIQGVVDALLASRLCTVGSVIVSNDIERMSIQIQEESFAAEDIQQIAWDVFPNLRQITRSREEPIWQSGLAGVHQLMTLALLSHRSG